MLRYFAELDERLSLGGTLICPREASPPEFLMDIAVRSSPEMIEVLAREWPLSALGRETELLASEAVLARSGSGGRGAVQGSAVQGSAAGAGAASAPTSEETLLSRLRTSRWVDFMYRYILCASC